MLKDISPKRFISSKMTTHFYPPNYNRIKNKKGHIWRYRIYYNMISNEPTTMFVFYVLRTSVLNSMRFQRASLHQTYVVISYFFINSFCILQCTTISMYLLYKNDAGHKFHSIFFLCILRGRCTKQI